MVQGMAAGTPKVTRAARVAFIRRTLVREFRSILTCSWPKRHPKVPCGHPLHSNVCLHSQYLLYRQVPIPRGTGLKTGIQLCLVPILLGWSVSGIGTV